MTFIDWGVMALAILVVLGIAGYGFRQHKGKRTDDRLPQPQSAADNNPYKISYVPSDMEWSGSISGEMTLKTLTYKQYECLEDARYGFKIVGVTPSERKQEQPHKTRSHSLKTVASLVKHGFLMGDDAGGYAITDHGLNALEVCSVRY